MKGILILIGIAVALLVGVGVVFIHVENMGKQKPLPSISASEVNDRAEFLRTLESGFNSKVAESQKVKFSLAGKEYNAVRIYAWYIDSDFPHNFRNQSELKSRLRQEGFKFVVFDNGKKQWEYDLWKD